ncbi:Metallo-dependent phosphatase-like protein [Pisolithus tinctorius]|nr:Metallo-dependent phosphatase-like protein [Pisolithus tinctorius]
MDLTAEHLPEQDMKNLCDTVLAILLEESNMQPVSSPVTICGDIHGSSVPETSYIFMGDFVDRGHYSLETVSLLLALKVRYPDTLSECQQKYGSAAVWKACCNVFDYLNLAAIVDGETLCVHGGLPPDIRTLDQIRVLSRAQEIPHEGAFSLPQFNHVNSLSLIARAHQLVQEGYKYMFDNALVTLWSAPNYCYRCGNMASVFTLREGGEHEFKVFGPAPENERDKDMGRRYPGMQYFE